MPRNVEVYNAAQAADLERLARDLEQSYVRAARAHVAVDDAEIEGFEDEINNVVDVRAIAIPEFEDLIGLDPSVRRQIEAALRAGKRHIMLYGPPGTGKTEIARKLSGVLASKFKLVTGSADWSSQDIIGGYQPVGNGEIAFVPGVLLQNFDRPLIIDELNRCDIDKVIGPLFTVLSGHASTLPYRTDLSDAESEQYVILPNPKPGKLPHEFAPGSGWRIIATINSIDKASLYQMSYALARRFGWIYVDAPKDLDAFVMDYAKSHQMLTTDVAEGQSVPLAGLWRAVNSVRVIGPAPIIDLIETLRAVRPNIDLSLPPSPDDASAYLDGFELYVMPMLDGISRHEASLIGDAASAALNLSDNQKSFLHRRLRELAL